MYNVARAYGGGLAGPIAIWTFVALLFLGLATINFGFPKLSHRRLIVVIASTWGIHGLIIWLTVVKLLGFFLFSALHFSTSEFKQEVYLMVNGCTKFALISTTALIIGTVISLLKALQKPQSEAFCSSRGKAGTLPPSAHRPGGAKVLGDIFS